MESSIRVNSGSAASFQIIFQKGSLTIRELEMGKKKDAKRAAKRAAEEANRTPGDSEQEMSGKDYDKELRKLHVELVKMQDWVRRKGLKVCVVFEGRDGAGKGGVIKAITERVSPRTFRVVALQAPTEREKSQMYVQRFIRHFPSAGEVVIFDRSWYNRAGVERVMGFCSREESAAFLKAAPDVEKSMVDSGIILVKYWLEVTQEEQTRRLTDRITDGRKTWKLSPMDIESYGRWDDYTDARDDMFAASHTAWAPWHIAHSDDKRRARLNIISHLLSQIPYKSPKREEISLPKRDAPRESHARELLAVPVPEVF